MICLNKKVYTNKCTIKDAQDVSDLTWLVRQLERPILVRLCHVSVVMFCYFAKYINKMYLKNYFLIFLDRQEMVQ